MATPVANLQIKLAGEQEYKAAVSEINSTLRRLDSELKKADAQFADNASSLEALSQKHSILSEKVSAQQKKVDELRKAVSEAESVQEKANKAFEKNASTLDKSSDEYKEMIESLRKANVQADTWKTSLNNAEAALAKMQGELDANTDALKKMTSPLDKVRSAFAATKEQGGGVKEVLANLKDEFTLSTDSANGLGTALTDIAGHFGIQLPESASKAASALNGINAGAALAVTGIGLLAAAIVKAEKALISMTKESAEYAKEIKTISSVTGQSAESLQEFDYAAEMIGVSSDRIRDSLKETTNKMQEAATGTGDAYEAYNKLGVEITDVDGQLRSAEDVFYDTIDALGEMKNKTERDALAMDLMSESAQELNPLIEIGSDGLKQYAQEAHSMGYVLDNEALTALTEVDDAYQRLQKSQEGAKNQLSAEFAPYLTEFYEKITKLIKDGGQALKDSGIVDSFGMLLETVGDIIAPTDQLSSDTVPKLTEALRPLAEIMAGIADTIDFISGAATVLTTGIWDWDKWSGGWKQMGKAAGFGYSYGNGNNTQTLKEKWEQTDVNRATSANGYGQYYANGKWYSNYESYLRDEWEKSGTGTTFEYWKMQKGYNASGTDYWRGGRTLIGEYGPEEVVLPQGTRILTAQETRQSSGGDTFYITIPANTVKEFNDIVNIARNKRRTDRMGVDKE
jgi:predicted  nucleic acid-binding Zn-ribbon protein